MKNKSLNAIAKVIAGQSPPSETYNNTGEGLPFFQGKADFQTKFPRVRSWCSGKNIKEAFPGDILMSVRAPVGPVNVCNQRAVIGRGISAIRPLEGTHGDYLYYFLKSNEEKIANFGTGSTFKAITQQTLAKIQIPFPEFDDQIRIATLLSRVEALIATRKDNLRLLDEFLKSTFLEMFGDPVRNEKGWDTKKLPQLASSSKNSIKRGPFGGALKKEIFIEDGYLVYEQHHALNNDYSFKRYFINEKKYNELIDFSVQPGDIIISCSGVYLGKLSIVPAFAIPGIINQALLKITLNKNEMNSIFFVNVFTAPSFKYKHILANRGSGIPNLPPMPIIKNIDFITPPITLQNQFAAIVEKVDSLKNHYQQNLTELENLYGAFSQKAFKGELDLSRVPLAESANRAENVPANRDRNIVDMDLIAS